MGSSITEEMKGELRRIVAGLLSELNLAGSDRVGAPKAASITGMSESAIGKLLRNPRPPDENPFPPPEYVLDRRVWRVRDLEEWVAREQKRGPGRRRQVHKLGLAAIAADREGATP